MNLYVALVYTYNLKVVYKFWCLKSLASFTRLRLGCKSGMEDLREDYKKNTSLNTVVVLILMG